MVYYGSRSQPWTASEDKPGKKKNFGAKKVQTLGGTVLCSEHTQTPPWLDRPCFRPVLVPLTCLFEDLLIWRDHWTEAVKDQGTQFQRILLWALIVIQGVMGEHKPPLLQFQGRHLRTVFHFFVQPPWKERRKGEFQTIKRNSPRPSQNVRRASRWVMFLWSC